MEQQITEAQHFQQVRVKELAFVKEMQETEPEFCEEAELAHFIERCAEFKTLIDMAYLKWNEDVRNKIPLCERWFRWYMADVEGNKKKLKRYYCKLVMKMEGKKGSAVTPEMIQIAREASSEH